jgi:homoserine O-acetyltransferase
MKAARATALMSYRHYGTFERTQQRPEFFLAESGGKEDATALDGAASYQRYQGEKLAKRFSAFSYYTLSLSMDSHDVGRGRGGAGKALQNIRALTLVIGIETDILFPLSEQKFLATHIPGSVYRSIDSLYGHDGFLLEFGQIEGLIREFMSGKGSGQAGERDAGELEIHGSPLDLPGHRKGNEL